MPTLPKAEDVQKIREQATHALEGAVGQARQPLLAALGAGDLAAQAVRDTLGRIRTELDKRAESARADLPSDLNELRGQFDPAELRKRLDAYTQSAVKLYDYLAERGEGALERIQTQPQVKRARTQAEAAQEKVGEVAGEVRELADDVLGKVTKATRSYGEKAAEQTEQVAEEAAEAVQEAGDKAATATRSATRKAAAKTSAAKSTPEKSSTAKKPSATKSTTQKSSES